MNFDFMLCQLYKLENQGDEQKWIYIDIGYMHINTKNELILLQKETNAEVMKHTIKSEQEYQFDNEEAIQFRTNCDYAVSFSSTEGARTNWCLINAALNDEKEDQQLSAILPPVCEAMLDEILDSMNKLICGGPQTKQLLQNFLMNKRVDYLEKLQKLFFQLEKQNDQQLLTVMSQIVKNIVTVAEQELFQIILNDQNYLFIFGALEYDEEMSKKDFVPHRQFFEKKCQFIRVAQIISKERVKTIHFIYRLEYLRDCGLAYYIDECQLMFIKIVLTCYSDLFKYIQCSKDFLMEVVVEFRNYNFQALRFLSEMCSVFKEYPDLNKAVIYQKLSEYGLYEIIEDYITDSLRGFEKYKVKQKKQKVKIADDVLAKVPSMILELLIACLQHSPNHFRAYIISEHQQVLKYPLFALIVDNISNELFMVVLKLLIENNPEEPNETMDLFLVQFYPKMAAQISHQTPNEKKIEFVEISKGLARAVKQQIKEAFIQNQTISKIGFILQENQKIEQMKCLQFFKSITLARDEDINNEIISAIPNLIAVILGYKRIRENLIFSQLLELIKIIYEGISQKIIQAFEEELKKWDKHSNYSRVYDIFKNLKANCMKQQFSQQQVTYDPKVQQNQQKFNVIDDEMDLFKSVQGHNNVHNIKQQKKLVDYDDDGDLVSKKIKLD